MKAARFQLKTKLWTGFVFFPASSPAQKNPHSIQDLWGSLENKKARIYLDGNVSSILET
jgi:hypothetical protein